ncbi:MAG: LysR family transcriptional regulator [Clostridium sp.]
MQTIDFVNSFDYNFFNTFMGGIFVDFKQLTYIITIAEEHNLTKAAERLFVSQSTLSLYLNKLERETRRCTFTRNKNRLTITPEGEEYVKTARKILELRNDLYKKLKISQNQFSLSIGISCQTLFEQFGQIYADFHEIFPNISVRVTEGWSKAIIEKLYDGKLDLAFAGFPEIINNPLFNTEVIKTDELLVLLSPQHAYAHLASRDYDNPPSVDMRLFSRESFILSGHGVCEYLLAQNMFHDYNIAHAYHLRDEQSPQYLPDGIKQQQYCPSSRLWDSKKHRHSGMPPGQTLLSLYAAFYSQKEKCLLR